MPPSRKKRGVGFSQKELDSLLDAIEEILPIGSQEWEAVERQHRSMYPESDRNQEALKRKFGKLYLKKIPTGDPHCPPEVIRAKRIYDEIRKRTDLSSGEDNGEQLEIEQDIHQADDELDEGAEQEDESDFFEDATEEQLVSADKQSGTRSIAGRGGGTRGGSSIHLRGRSEAAGARYDELSLVDDGSTRPAATTTATTTNSRKRAAATALNQTSTTRRASPFLSSQLSRVGSKSRARSSREENEDFSFKDMFQMTMMQRQMESEERHREERLRREYEDMRRRDEERMRRDEERIRREEMRQNQQMFQQMFAMTFAMQHPHLQTSISSQQVYTNPAGSIGNRGKTQRVTTDLTIDDVSNGGNNNRVDDNHEENADDN
jgi:hypothetical protein